MPRGSSVGKTVSWYEIPLTCEGARSREPEDAEDDDGGERKNFLGS